MQMWDLYQLAMQGMLQAQYLISSYPFQESDQFFTQDDRPKESLLGFKVYRARSFEQGTAVIEAISDVEQSRAARDETAAAQTLVMLGDWRLWNDRTEGAWEAYRAAETELATSGDAQTKMQQLFGEPVALPDIAELNPLPPLVEQEQADVVLAFAVSDQGRVHKLERMDDNEVADPRASRLMRQLRKTTFRPRSTAGQPVETENIVKAFDIQ